MNKFKIAVIWFFGLLIILIALLSTIVSTGLSIAYFTELTNDSNLQMVVIGFIILLQSMVLIGSIVKSVIYKRCPQHYNKIIWFTNICFIISVLSTISFFNQFDKIQRKEVIEDLLNFVPWIQLNTNEWLVSNLTNMTLIWLSCIVIDLMSMFFPSIGSDLISGISIKEKIQLQEIGYLTKIWKLITYLPKNWIDKKCIEYKIIKSDTLNTNSDTPDTNNLNTDTKSDTKNPIQKENVSKNQIQELPNTIQNNNNKNVSSLPDKKEILNVTNPIQPDTKKPCNLDIEQSNQCNGHVTTQEIEYTIPDTKQDTKNKLDTKNPIQKKKNPIHDTKSNTKPDTKSLIEKIDEYIILKYKPGDKINVSELKKEFNFKKQDRNWNDKIRPNLKSASINKENSRLTRIQLDEKDKFKIVK